MKTKDTLDSFTVETHKDRYTGDTEFWVYGWGTYGPSSVLAGQSRKVFMDRFETLEEAYKAYPKARPGAEEYRDEDDTLADISGLSSEPPEWFDPSDAGESWDSD